MFILIKNNYKKWRKFINNKFRIIMNIQSNVMIMILIYKKIYVVNFIFYRFIMNIQRMIFLN